MLFHALMLLLRRWLPNPGWITIVVTAGTFALSHLVKSGITPWQIAAIFLTGCLYGWLRLDRGSTVPPLSHMRPITLSFSAWPSCDSHSSQY